MINILFVDDEPKILQGLQRMLRPMRDEWQMWFANSGEESLGLLEEQNIEVVVSDMRMPRMDGAQLLTEVRSKYPQIIRIILSGYSEKEMVMKSVGAAHQYLSKPCDAEILKHTIESVRSLQSILNNDVLRRLVAQMPHVPSLPDLYFALKDELKNPEPSTQKVAEIIKKDIGMTVKILQIVNSAFFSSRRTISDTKEAINYLGLDTINSLTLGLAVISQFEGQQISGIRFADVWSHSTNVGAIANKIARSVNSQVATDAFTAGLLHDIGEVILAANLPEQFARVNELQVQENISKAEAEREIFDATHADVGAYLLGIWGLPKNVVEAVAYHHCPREALNNSFSALTAVHAANAINKYTSSQNPEMSEPEFDHEYLTTLGLAEKFPVWLEKYSDPEGN
ncbi:MAG: HDOD domain-containing protein [Pyrinomonadaceae bacterium]|nr:HDOD domain-containing protein [Pyrinomonadaceae bacterium]